MNITEKTKVNVNLATAWGVIVSVISATIWITMMVSDMRYKIEKLYIDNQRHQTEMVERIAGVANAQKRYAVKSSVEDLIILMEKRKVNLTLDEELAYRRLVRDALEKE